MASRKIEDLHPEMQKKAREFLELCAKSGIDVLIYCTYRSQEEQAELYAQGRTKPGKIVTYAKPGYSYHNYGLAFDCVPLVGGKPVWDNKGLKPLALWQKIGEIGVKLGLEWGGNWKRFREYPHFQLALYPIESLCLGTIENPFISLIEGT